MPRSDLAASIILMLFGAVVVFESWRMPRFESIGGNLYSAPGLVPGLLGAVIALLGGVMFMRYLVNKDKPLAEERPVPVSEATLDELVPEPDDRVASEDLMVTVGSGLEAPSNSRMLWTLGLGVLFAAGMVGRMPFWLATFIFVFAFIIIFERQNYRDRKSTVVGLLMAAGIAGITSFAVPFVFEQVFLVNLP